MSEIKKSNKSGISEVTLGTTVFITIITLFIGFIAGLSWENFKPYLGAKNSSSDSIDLSSVQNLYRKLKENYDGDLDKKALIEGAKRGLVSAAGDEYTSYMTESEAKDYRTAIEGDIKEAGIGISFAKREDYVRVLRTLPDNPAREAGVLAGDIIFAIDDVEVWQEDAESIMLKLRGEEGSKIKLTVVRNREKIDFDLTRATINNVSADVSYDGDIAILSIYRFSSDTYKLVKELASDIASKNPRGLIVDLRGNGGGYVNAARDILGLWVSGEKVLIQKSRIAADAISYSPRGEAIFKDLKTVVLINNGTASASEIMVGALKDYEKATIVGEKSYGKGVMQALINVDSNALLKVTAAHWYTPKENSIDGTGITPDIEVKRTYEEINKGIDPQLDKAKELLTNQIKYDIIQILALVMRAFLCYNTSMTKSNLRALASSKTLGPTPVIEVKNLSKTYGKRNVAFKALEGINLKIYPGESVAIIGKSGSGKSTLMHLMALLDKPTTGSIKILGMNASKLKGKKLNRLRNRYFGFVFQQFFMNSNDTVLENVLLPLKIGKVSRLKRKKLALKALDIVDLENKAKNKATNLSGGQKQRVCIARAIVNNPKIIFADEPTGNLDSGTGKKIIDLLFDLNKHGATLIIVTHDEDLAALCGRQIRIVDGKIVAETKSRRATSLRKTSILEGRKEDR